ncbi:MAG: DUF423 domain-containing protein [Chloroflexi bacterium]|nr:DUF423 domain-containing protein [Chloroflexota bacterium]
MTRPPTIIAIAAIFGLISVIAGAAGTHALRDTLDAGALNTFETAARFQMYHALALLAVGLLSMRWQARVLTASAALFTLGTILFSGSLYILALTGIGIFGAVAPVGGLCLMVGWASLILAAFVSRG